MKTVELEAGRTAWEIRSGQTIDAYGYNGQVPGPVIDHRRRRASVDKKLEAFAAELEQHVQPEGEVRGAVCRRVGELAGTLKPPRRR